MLSMLASPMATSSCVLSWLYCTTPTRDSPASNCGTKQKPVRSRYLRGTQRLRILLIVSPECLHGRLRCFSSALFWAGRVPPGVDAHWDQFGETVSERRPKLRSHSSLVSPAATGLSGTQWNSLDCPVCRVRSWTRPLGPFQPEGILWFFERYVFKTPGFLPTRWFCYPALPFLLITGSLPTKKHHVCPPHKYSTADYVL